MNKYDKELQQLETNYEQKKKELTKLSLASKAHQIPEELRELADFLHSKLCKYNHTDQCDYHYDNGDWTAYSRKEYLKKAENVIKVTDSETVKKVVEAITKF